MVFVVLRSRPQKKSKWMLGYFSPAGQKVKQKKDHIKSLKAHHEIKVTNKKKTWSP